MTTTDEVLNMFLENVKKFNKNPNSKPRHTERRILDQESDIYVTDLCVYSTYCPRSTFYNKVVQRPITEEAKLRFTAGHYVHDIPINSEENEVPFHYKGFNCRMDDISSKKGWIADKKTVSSLPIGAKEYVTKQLNVYRVIAEENETKPFKVNNLYVLSIDINSGETSCHEAPMWTKEEAKKFMFETRAEILQKIRNRELPDLRTGWWCKSCQYKDLCKINAIEDVADKNKPVKEKTKQTLIEEFKENKEDKNNIKVCASNDNNQTISVGKR